MAKIHCSVNNCHYWDRGNICNASEIMVAGDTWAEQAPDNVGVQNAESVPQIQANNCMETCCKTFVEKGSADINVDGVTRNPY